MKRFLCAALAIVCLLASCSPAGNRPPPTPARPAALVPAGWQGARVRTVCLDVRQTIAEAPATFALPVEWLVSRTLDRLGVAVASARQACDANLLVQIDGVPVARDYMCVFGSECGHCYTGARITGEMRLTTPGRSPVSLPLEQASEAPISISYCPRKPEQAPFEPLWLRAVLGGLLDLWGPGVLDAAYADKVESVRREAVYLGYRGGLPSLPMLTRALSDKSANVRTSALRPLEFLGEGAKDAVPALIHLLDDKNLKSTAPVVDALQAITGYDYGADSGRWRAWLAEGAITPTPWTTWQGVPIMPGSRWIRGGASVGNFTVGATCDEVKAYYLAAMPAAGWRPSGPAHFPAASFDRGGGTMSFNYYDSSVGAGPRCSVSIWLPD